jgi:Asp-tRNA(Asn)/Glu-tRNA(Gln) amidotransferase A subunit family amidase
MLEEVLASTGLRNSPAVESRDTKAYLEHIVKRGTNRHLSANSGLPAIVVPGGFTPAGLPVGVELLGRAWSEPLLIKLAYAYEQATRHRRPPASTCALARP